MYKRQLVYILYTSILTRVSFDCRFSTDELLFRISVLRLYAFLRFSLLYFSFNSSGLFRAHACCCCLLRLLLLLLMLLMLLMLLLLLDVVFCRLRIAKINTSTRYQIDCRRSARFRGAAGVSIAYYNHDGTAESACMARSRIQQ